MKKKKQNESGVFFTLMLPPFPITKLLDINSSAQKRYKCKRCDHLFDISDKICPECAKSGINIFIVDEE